MRKGQGERVGGRPGWHPRFPSYTSPVTNRICPFASNITLKHPFDEESPMELEEMGLERAWGQSGTQKQVRSPSLWPRAQMRVRR